jgi:hypothetical protein
MRTNMPGGAGAGGLVETGRSGGRCRTGGASRVVPSAPRAHEARGHCAPGVEPGGAGSPVDGLVGSCEGFRSEGLLDPGAHGVEIDPDGGQGVPVEGAEQRGADPESDLADDLLLDVLRRDTVPPTPRARRREPRSRNVWLNSVRLSPLAGASPRESSRQLAAPHRRPPRYQRSPLGDWTAPKWLPSWSVRRSGPRH